MAKINNSEFLVDVAVIGAGMAGLVCAQQLHLAGYKVVVVEKSRGLGGRVATRRLYDTCADHGACYLKPKGELLGRFVQLLCDGGILQLWSNTYKYAQNQLNKVTDPVYVAPDGISAIAKFLAAGLDIRRSQRLTALNLDFVNWTLHINSDDITKSLELTAKAVVMAIPAPQALSILQQEANTVPAVFLEQLSRVEFDPCLSVIAGYPTQLHPPPDWKAITFVDDSVLRWIGLDSSKRTTAQSSVFVLHSSADFARRHLEAKDFQPMGHQMLAYASECLQLPLKHPEWMQVHRWRYAFPSRCLDSALSAQTELPLVCCGDWCGGDQIESAMHSGIAAAEELNRQMYSLSLPGYNFLDFLSDN